MRTSHKLTRLILALMTLVVLSTMALAQAANIAVSDQKAGSVLVYPYYVHSSAQATRANTRISITNVSNAPANAANLTRVHLFLLSGSTCTQADIFVCLTPNATAAFEIKDFDPENSGYIIAVAVDQNGLPTQNNVLIGNAFVSQLSGSDNYEGNYGAEAFWRTAPGSSGNAGDLQANVVFDTATYDPVPNLFGVEIQSPVDSTGQRIIAAGLSGNLNSASSLSGCAQSTTGQGFNQNEKFVSFQGFLSGSCLCSATISSTNPRVPGGLGNLILSGQAGSLKIPVTAAVGLILTPRNATNKWSGIRTLHKLATRASTTLTIPVFTPVC